MAGSEMTCCICLEDFAEKEDLEESRGDQEVVILPCKAHFYHEVCIGEWIKKNNACPICRETITLTKLRSQDKEVKALLKKLNKKQKKQAAKPAEAVGGINDSFVSLLSEESCDQI